MNTLDRLMDRIERSMDNFSGNLTSTSRTNDDLDGASHNRYDSEGETDRQIYKWMEKLRKIGGDVHTSSEETKTSNVEISSTDKNGLEHTQSTRTCLTTVNGRVTEDFEVRSINGVKQSKTQGQASSKFDTITSFYKE
ncbi:uncharacterized protein I303_101658 [Kwoniella dejecticola CBS 10117]|uniref:Uncharacterized protein n=1 Tax=Kwoniella dejecticola CBS 10117 TaxID=1296121 RepID=A0A1A6AD59_9TREE|nr:uncharacterized protein I303_02205 [Kwoniella dejecticola CBS 10117]OBR87989.1 hypothetical protein I303_02205 [Kwoniella dejecticola CBS 10117]